MTDITMKALYKKLDYTKGHYIIGTHEHGTVYAHVLDNFHFSDLSYADVSSRGAGACLKYRQTGAHIRTIREHATYSFPLCSVDYLERVAKAYGKRANRGKAFEKILTEYFGQVWEDDHVPFWEAGDIVINGQPYQIKYDRCNFCNEKQLKGLGFEG